MESKLIYGFQIRLLQAFCSNRPRNTIAFQYPPDYSPYAMEGWLNETNTDRKFPLSEVTILGRSADCGVCIPLQEVSRRHAMIRRQDDGFWYFDLGSFNGSYINDRRVVTAQKLALGDIIHLSGHELVFSQSGVSIPAHSDLMGASTMAHVRSTTAILLVTDIQGFTALSEAIEPSALARIIGSWYSFTEQILARHGATLDKFIGDCALAYWTDSDIPNRIHAIRAAGEMQQSCINTYEAHRNVLDAAGLSFGACAAIHIGRVAYGGISAQEFTLLGDAVNVAFRVEALTRLLKEPVLVTDAFLSGWEKGPSYCRALGPQAIKGRSEPVSVHAVDRVPGP